MKELTIEQKAKAYDEAKARMSAAYNSNRCTIGFMNEIFPELTESEDERIKKALSDILLIDSDEIREILDSNNLLMQDIDSWLKNQGKQKSIDDLTQQEAMDIAVAKCFDEQKSDDLRTTGYWHVEDIEQNYSVNKVEPKFHEGEWITNGDYTWKIVEVKPLDYILQSQDGNIVDDTISHVDEQFHSFAIEDARDGDVLALNDKTIVIFKDLYSSTTFHAYCYVKEGTFSVSQDDIPDWWNSEGFYPATKEQRDTLEKAMANAGWEFDFDNKELKKINQEYTPKHKVGDTIYYNSFGEVKSMIVANVITDSTDNPMYEDENGSAVFEEDLIEPKPAWSEEDEEILNTIINDIQERHPEAMWKINAGSTVVVSTQYIIDWLKSIKGRVQPQVKWGEWGKKYIASTIKMVEHCSFSSIGGITKAAAITWLKSLGPQTVWKPSDEQMEFLKKCIEAYNEVTFPTEVRVLSSLYNDLKKL